MKLLGKSKVTKQQSKPEFTYPLIRLPQSEVNLAGETRTFSKQNIMESLCILLSLDEDFEW